MSAENKQQISSAIKMNIKSKQLFFLKKIIVHNLLTD